MSLYSTLPQGGMRFLRLLPSSDERSRIECRLFTCALLESGSTHPYEALSYVWGPENTERSVYINDYELPVRANLHAALSHLRDRFMERIIWGRCYLHQPKDEGDEKEQQIQSMARIYAKAIRVIVWLGEAVAGSDQALQEILNAQISSTQIRQSTTRTSRRSMYC